ncbi:condensation domain-containing protein, partial [Actinoalloteichus spitiensis]|uniref:condensation domain-containing protein n=1 Tax=Actinoalloteichus spitiensis TaxID=252394 RepID=UPI000584442C
VQYADYAAWQRQQFADSRWTDELSFWRRQLADVAPLELPSDRPRSTTRTTAGANFSVELPAALLPALRKSAREQNASLFVVLAAVTKLLFARLSGSQDVALGTVTSGRESSELEEMLGFFVNTLVLRSHVDEERSFSEFLSQVRGTVVDAFDHRQLPFDRLVDAIAPDRDSNRMPLVQAMLVLQNTPDARPSFGGLDVSEVVLPREASSFDLTVEFRENGDELTFGVEYNTDLFDAGTVERWARDWVRLAEAVTAEPERRLVEV